MRALVIDPFRRAIREREIAGDLQSMYAALSEGPFKVDMLEIAQWYPTGDVLYVDEEGLFKPGNRSFWIDLRPDQPLFGIGLLLGSDQQGDNVDVKMSLGTLSGMIAWSDHTVRYGQ